MQIEDVVRVPLPGYGHPTDYRFGPGDRMLTWLASPEAGLRLALFGMEFAEDGTPGERRILIDPRELGGDESKLTLEEQLRRERLRMRALGVTSYQWADRANVVLAPIGGALFLHDVAAGTTREVVAAGGPAIEEPRLSPDGAWIGFVRDAELHVVPAAGGAPRQVTHGARGTGRTHGLAEYCAQEEMHRHEGWWWNDDATLLAFTEVDETHIPVYRIVHQGKDAVGDGAQEDHRYPFAGAANAKVRLGIVSRDGGEPRWIDLGAFEYLARVRWMDGATVFAQTQNRRQDRLDLWRIDAATGRAEIVVTETSSSWVNLDDHLTPVPPCAAAPQGGFLWASERSGFMHLSLRDRGGRELAQITSGDWLVANVAGMDAERGLVWFRATKESPLEMHLYEAPLAGGTIRRITAEPGMHAAVLDRARRRFVSHHSSERTPPTIRIRNLSDGSEVVPLHTARDPRIDELGLRPPELLSVRAADGTTLHGVLYRPGPAHGPGPWPLLVKVYGGPHVQSAVRSWEVTAQMRAQYLAEQGFLVLALDNRGSWRRGLAFESAIHRNMGDLEVRDQVDGVRRLVELGLADPKRVGIYGWSYGGYMSAMALCRAPDVFRAACAGAPVTHWDGYDTHYTERYMDLPSENPEGYRTSSVMHHVPQMRGALLLVHGMLDENVHFRHTARLVNALNHHRKRYEILLYPDERHMPRVLADRIDMEAKVVAFFRRELA